MVIFIIFLILWIIFAINILIKFHGDEGFFPSLLLIAILVTSGLISNIFGFYEDRLVIKSGQFYVCFKFINRYLMIILLTLFLIYAYFIMQK